MKYMLLLFVIGVCFLSHCGYNKIQQQAVKEDQLKIKTNKTIFSFFGAPGSGKGTLASDCVKKLGFKVLSTGNLCREAIARGDTLGKSIEQYIKSGQLIPDDLVTKMVDDWLKKEADSGVPVILDGYPRTQKQAQLFLNLLKRDFSEFKFRVISLLIPDEEIVKRLSDRLICENKRCQTPTAKSLLKDPNKLECPICSGKLIKREDDNEAVVRERLKVYAQHSGDLLHFYKESGQLIEELNVSDLTVEQVFEGFKRMLEKNCV